MKKNNIFYDKNFKLHKKDYLINGWGSSFTQKKRFEIFLKIGSLKKKKILDVGCGTCSFYKYLKDNKISIKYYGLDNNDNMIKTSQKKYNDIILMKMNFFSNLKLKKNFFDYIFLSGALNIAEYNHEKNTKNLIKKLFYLSKKGVAINFLSIYSKKHYSGEFYFDPIKIFKFAFSLSKKCILYHNYLDNDFTIFIYR